MQEDTTTGWAGWAAFAGFMLLVIGVFQAIAGITAIVNDGSVIYGGIAVKYVLLHLNTARAGAGSISSGVSSCFLAGLGSARGPGVGTHRRCDRRHDQRDRELRVHPDLPGVVVRHHHRERARDLGARRPWS